MEWVIEFTDEFGKWWERLTQNEQEDVSAVIDLLEVEGIRLSRPPISKYC